MKYVKKKKIMFKHEVQIDKERWRKAKRIAKERKQSVSNLLRDMIDKI